VQFAIEATDRASARERAVELLQAALKVAGVPDA
jgi:hypothetical protein